MFPLLLASLATTLAAPAAAQVGEPVRLFALHLNLGAQDQSVAGVATETDGLSLTIDGIGSFRLVPAVAGDRFSITVHRGENPMDVGRAVEVVHLSAGEVAPVRSIPSAAVVVDSSWVVRPQAAPAGLVSHAPVADAQESFCCYSCGIVTACGCKVKMDCGGCCIGVCCPVGDLEPIGSTAASDDCRHPIPDAERLAMERLGLAVVRRSAN